MPRRSAEFRRSGLGCAPKAKAAQRSSAATDPQVPGPGLPRPAPKKVATVQAQRVFFSPLIGAFVVAAGQAAEILEDFRIEHRRADLVDT